MPAPSVLSPNSELRRASSSDMGWSSTQRPTRSVSFSARSQIRSPALWVLVWLSAAGGFLIGYSDGPGASFVPALSEISTSGAFRGMRSSLDPFNCKFRNRSSLRYISLKPMASFVSALAMAFLAQRVGRKNTISIGATVYIAAFLVQSFKPSEAQLFAGRALVGVSEGLLMTVYVGAVELASKYNRGVLASFDAVGRGMGMLCQGMLIYGLQTTGTWGWSVYTLFGATFGGFIFCLLNFGGLPDTPASLVQRGRLQEARESLQMLRNPLMAAETEAEYQLLLRECTPTTLKQGPFARRWLPRTLLAMLLAIIYNLQGGVLTKYNMPAVLARTVAVDSLAWGYLLFMAILGGGALVGALVALATADRVGRRKMLTAICIVNAMLCAIAAILVLSGFSFGTIWGMAMMLVMLALLSASHTAGPQAIMLLYASEIQPLSNRTLVFGGAVALNELWQAWVSAAVARYACRHMSYGMLIFMALNMFCGVLMWTLLPETARLDSDEIDRAFDRHWLWGRFSQPQTSAGLTGGGSIALPKRSDQSCISEREDGFS